MASAFRGSSRCPFAMTHSSLCSFASSAKDLASGECWCQCPIFGGVDVVDAGIGQSPEDRRGIAFSAGPLMVIVGKFPLGDANADDDVAAHGRETS